MRVFNQVFFDEVLVGTSPYYTDPQWNSLLGMADKVGILAVADGVSGTSPTLTVALEMSADNRNFVQKNATPEINLAALSTTQTSGGAGDDNAATPSLGFVRFRLVLGGTTPVAHVRLWVTGRGEVAST